MKTERVLHLLELEKQYALKQTGFQQKPINKEVAEALDIAIEAVKQSENYISKDTYDAWLKSVEAMAEADLTQVKHGKWLKTDAFPHRVYCSLCYKTYVTNEEIIQGRSWEYPAYCTEAEYCPHCGAKMDSERGTDNGC